MIALAAHVTYIASPETIETFSGTDWEFFLAPLRDPFYLALIVTTVLVTLALFVTGVRRGPVRTACHHFHDRLLAYREHVPVILRLALGIALICAGTDGALYLPNVSDAAVGTLEVVVGFFLVVGFASRLSGLAALGLFAYGLHTSHYLLGTLESAAAGLLIVALGGGRPSVDDAFGIDVLGELFDPAWRRLREHIGPIMRLALGSTMIWLAVTEKVLNPRVSEAVVIEFGLESLIPVSSAMWVFAVGVIELAVGVVLVLGIFARTWSVVAFVVLTLSFFIFREEVAGHVTFFGALLVLMVTGAGRWSVDALVASRTRHVTGTDQPYGTVETGLSGG